MDLDVGYTVHQTQPNVIPFNAREDDLKALHSYYRMHMQLHPAQATTTHEAQGITSKDGVVAFPTPPDKKPWARGLEYVMCTRQTALEKLHLKNPLREEHLTSNAPQKVQVDNEYNRLKIKIPITMLINKKKKYFFLIIIDTLFLHDQRRPPPILSPICYSDTKFTGLITKTYD
jgi:hypothetical protein